MSSNTSNFLVSALESVYGPLIKLSERLPAPLAYALAVLVAILVAFLVSISFGTIIPTSIIWSIHVINITGLVTFVFIDWQKRQSSKEKSSINHILESSVFYVVVHEVEDQTNIIPDAEVTIALPETVTKKTGSNGTVIFIIPNELIGKEFSLNARKSQYKKRQSTRVVLRRQGYEFIPLEPEVTSNNITALSDSATLVKQPRTSENSLSKLIYNSDNEEEPFISWTLFSSVGAIYNHISIVKRDSDKVPIFRLTAVSDEFVGVNKSFRALHGRVEFEYKVEYSHSNGPNIFFYMIPMQETNIDRTGLIEVGTNMQDDQRNAFSPYRARFLVPIKHFGDGEWHNGGIDFDFREAPEAFYSIFGPRLNEGSSHPGAGVLMVTNVKLYSNNG